MKENSKGQISSEFLVLIALAVLMLGGFLYVAGDHMSDRKRESELISVKDFSMMVQSELYLAAQVRDGYRRQFSLPYQIDGMDYSINITGGELIVQTARIDYYLALPPLQGNITKGNNVITAKGGIIYLN